MFRSIITLVWKACKISVIASVMTLTSLVIGFMSKHSRAVMMYIRLLDTE